MKRNFLKLILSVCVFGIVLIPASLIAKDKNTIFGFTNVSKALILHPLMAKYKIKEGRFIPEGISKKSIASQKKRLSSLRNKRKKMIEKQKELEEKIEQIDKEYGLQLATLREKMQEEKSPISENNKYNKIKRQVENKFWKKRRELQLQINAVGTELADANKENSLLKLTTANETEHIFKLMLDDIYEAIEMVTTHYKIDIVMNSSFTIERTPVNPSFTPVNPMAEFLNKKFSRDAKEVLFKHGSDGSAPFAMTLDYWCASQRWAFRNCIDSRLDKMIIKGGLDMTPAVVDAIYQKYDIHASHRDVIREYFKSEKK